MKNKMLRTFGVFVCALLLFACFSFANLAFAEDSAINESGLFTQRVMIPAAENEGLSFDLYAWQMNDKLTFFLPARIDSARFIFSVDGERYSYPDTSSVTLDGAVYALQIKQSGLPSISVWIDEVYGSTEAMLTSPDHSAYAYGDLALDIPDESAASNGWETSFKSAEKDDETPGTIKIRGRGNSTWDPTPGVRKAFQINLEKKADLLGMGKSKKWVLLRNTQTMVTMMDKIAFELAERMGLPFTPECEFVDLFLNGEYMGLYLLTEKVEIDSERVNIADLDDEIKENGLSDNTDLTGGYLLEIDNYDDDLQFVIDPDTWLKATVKGPEDLSGDATASSRNLYAYIVRTFTDWVMSVYGDGYLLDGTHFMDAINMDSFSAYYWLEEFVMNHDAGFGSCYFHKNRDAIDPLIYAGPLWDSNNAFFISEQSWLVRNMMRSSGMPAIYNALMDHRAFADAAIAYYTDHDLRAIFEQIVADIDGFYASINIALDMDSLRWPSPYAPRSAKNFKKLLSERIAWIDSNVSQLSTLAVKSVDRTTQSQSWTAENLPAAKPLVLECAPLDLAFRLHIEFTNIEAVAANARLISIPGFGELYISTWNDAESGMNYLNDIKFQALAADGTALWQECACAGGAYALTSADITVQYTVDRLSIKLLLKDANGETARDVYYEHALQPDGIPQSIVLLDRITADRSLSANVISCSLEVDSIAK